MKHYNTPFDVNPETAKFMELKYQVLQKARDLGIDVNANMTFDDLFAKLLNSNKAVHIHIVNPPEAVNTSDGVSEEYCKDSPNHQHSVEWLVYEPCRYCKRVD